MTARFRFLHMADSHLGYAGNASRYNEYKPLRIEKLDDGLDVRQRDIDDAFRQAMDLAISHQVDAVLHAGDSWDFWKDNPHVENVHTREVTRLAPHGIDYIEIVGNHDLPKKIGKGCHLETLGRFPRVYTAYQGFYEPIDLPHHNVVIHAVPSTFRQDLLHDSLAAVSPVPGKINIGMGHFGVTTIKHYSENAVNSLVTDLDALIRCEMDYFALGDYHKTTHFSHNIWYAGSTERMGFGEVDNRPCVLLVDIDRATRACTVTPLYLNVRPMVDLPVIDAEGKSIEQLHAAIERTLTAQDLTGHIVRLRVRRLPTHLKPAIDAERLKDLTAAALYFKLEFSDKVNKTEEARTAGQSFAGVLEGWKPFVGAIEDDGSFDKEALAEIGLHYLMEAYEDAAD